MSGGISRRRVLGLIGGAAATGVVAACSSSSSGSPASSPGTPREVPPPAGFFRSHWADDRYTLGGYSYLPVGATPSLRTDLATPVDGWLHIAGEAVSAEAPATVHGARASGRAAADAVLEVVDSGATVVVVGAGAAGAAAARGLRDADVGLQVIVVEARERTGGRIWTTHPGDWPISLELGASFVHDVDASDSAEVLASLGVPAEPFTYATSYLDARGRRLADGDEVYAEGYAAIEEAIAAAEGQDEDVSLADALAATGAEGAGLALARRSEVEVELGVDAEELSAWWGLDEGTTGDDLIVVGGYGDLVDADLDGIDVRLDWPVTTIARRGRRTVLIRLDDEEEVVADHVIVTVPLAVLAADVIAFDPPLPAAHRTAIAGLGTGLLEKVWLHWDEPWWTEEAEVWSSVDGPFEWCNLLPATGEPVLLAFVGGSAARAWGRGTDTGLRAAALADLARFRAAGW